MRKSLISAVLSIPTILLFFVSSLSQSVLYETYSQQGKMAVERGDFGEGEKLLTAALNEAERSNNLELVAEACVNLGRTLHQSGRDTKKAETLYLRAIGIFDDINGKNDESSTFALNNLGLLYTEQKKFEQAEGMLRRVITIREKVVGSNDPDVGVTLINLGKLYQDQGKFTEADAIYTQALAIFLSNNGYESEVVTSTFNLASVNEQLKNYKRAEIFYKTNIEMTEKLAGRNHKSLIVPLEKYAALLRTLKRNAEAARIESRAKSLRRTE